MRISKSLRRCVGVLAVAALAGCAQSRPRRVAASEPPLLDGDGATTVVEAPPVRNVSVADRHPVLRRPREYYDTTNGGKLTKSAAAAVIGVPSGIVAEMRQIVSGKPAPR